MRVMVFSSRASRVVALVLVSTALAASVPAQDNLWVGASSFWDLASNWSLGLPVSGQRLFIGYAPHAFSGGTTFRSGSVSVTSLFSRNALTVSGGLLSLTSTTETSTLDAALNLSGGTLGGTANLTVAGLTTLTGGTLGGSGKLTANGGVNIASGTVRIADARTLENRGAMAWTGGAVNVDAGATVKNVAGSTFVADNASFFGTNAWTGGSLVNDGTLTHSTGTVTFSGVALSGTGTIESTGGDLRFEGAPGVSVPGMVKAGGFGQVTFRGGEYDVTFSSLQTSGGGRIAFVGATVEGGTWAPWVIPSTSTAGSVVVQDSTLKVGSVVNSDRLAFGGANVLEGVRGDRGFNFGAFSTQTIKNGFVPGGEVVLGYNARMAFDGDRTVDYVVRGTEGQYNPGSGIVMPAGARLTVGGTGALGGTGIAVVSDGSAFAFRNEGTLSATMGFNVDVAGGSLDNAGLMVAGGGIAENGGSNLRLGTGTFANSGTVRADGGALSIQAVSGATFTNTGTIEAINGGSVGVLWSAGTTESGAVRWTNTGTLRADGEGSRLFLGGTFRVADLGTLSVTNGARAFVAGTLDNDGQTLTLDHPGAWALTRGGRILGGDLINSTYLDLTSPYAANVLENVHLDGGLDLGDGGWVALVGSTHLNGLTNGNGRIDFAQDATLNHDIAGGVGLGATKSNVTITIAPGTTYSGYVSVNSGYPQVSNVNLVNEGTIRGTTGDGRIEGTVTNHGLIERTGGSQLVFTSGDLVNDGTIRAAGGNVALGGSGKIRNSGTMTATNGSDLAIRSFASGQSFVNAGTALASGVGSSLSFGMYSPFTLASLGDVRATDGAYLSVSQNGRLNLDGGTLVVGPTGRGLWRVEGGGTIYGGSIVNSELLGLSSQLNQQRLIDVSVDHGLNVGEGVVSLEGAFQSGGAVNVSGIGRVYTTLSRPIDYAIRLGTTASDNGEVHLGTQTFGDSPTISANGEISGRNAWISQTPNTLRVLNQGLIMAKGSGGRLELDGSFENQGTMRASEGGTLRLGDYGTLLNVSGTTLAGGTYRADANSKIQVRGLDVHENAANVILDGAGSRLEDASGNDALRNLGLNSGALAISGGRDLSLGQSLQNKGTLEVGSGSLLTVGGAFAQTSTGRLSLGLDASGIGRMSVTGSVALAGALDVSLLGGYVPMVGSTYTFLTYSGALSGTLSVNPRYTLVYGANSLGIQVNAVPEPAPLLALAGGVLALARRRRK